MYNKYILICVIILIYHCSDASPADKKYNKGDISHEDRLAVLKQYLLGTNKDTLCNVFLVDRPIGGSNKNMLFNMMHAAIYFDCFHEIRFQGLKRKNAYQKRDRLQNNYRKALGFEYNIKRDIDASFLPLADENGKLKFNKKGELVWENQAFIETLYSFNELEWTNKHKIGSVTIKQLHQIVEYIDKYFQANPRYKLWNTKSRNKKGEWVERIKSTTCEDFAFAVVEFMVNKLKLCLKPKENPKKVYIWANDYSKGTFLDAKDPKVQEWYTYFTTRDYIGKKIFKVGMKRRAEEKKPAKDKPLEKPADLKNNNDKLYLKFHDARNFYKRKKDSLTTTVKKILNPITKPMNNARNRMNMKVRESMLKFKPTAKLLQWLRRTWMVYYSPTKMYALEIKNYKIPVKWNYKSPKGLFNDENPNCKKM